MFENIIINYFSNLLTYSIWWRVQFNVTAIKEAINMIGVESDTADKKLLDGGFWINQSYPSAMVLGP